MTILLAGATDTTIDVQIVDDTGLPVIGLAAAQWPTVKYSKGTGADATISLSDLSALTDAHSDGGVYERGEGVYRLDLPDAVASAACPKVTVRGETTDKRVIAPALQVVSATQGLSGSHLDAAITSRLAPTTAGRTLDVTATGAAGIDWANVENPTTTLNLSGTTVKDATDVTTVVASGTHGNAALKTLIDTVDNFIDTEVAAIISAIGTPSNLGSGATLAANAVDISGLLSPIADIDSNVSSLNDLSTADIDARLAAIGLDHLVSTSVAGADVADNSIFAKMVSKSATADWDTFVNTTDALEASRDAILNAVDSATILIEDVPTNAEMSIFVSEISSNVGGLLGSNGANLSAIPWNAAWDAEVQSEATDALNAYDPPTNAEMEARTLVSASYATAANLATLATAVDAIDNILDTEFPALVTTVESLFTTAMTESYGADGAAVTPAQAFYEIMQSIGERSISSTTATVKKRDGSTTAFTQTLNDAVTPTAITRS